LAADAPSRGLSAVVLQTFNPWPCLLRLHEAGVRAIVSHRLSPSAPWGHFSVLVDIDEQGISLHDPQLGPRRRLPREAFLDLWRPSGLRSEAAGHVAVAINRLRQGDSSCRNCRKPIPRTAACPGCEFLIPLAPAEALGCMDASCSERLWQRLFCPRCDFALG
jgi:hypothetical protein